MVALFIAQKKTLLLHFGMYSTIACIIPKIATSFTRTQVLLRKNEKYQCATVRFLCAKGQDLLEPKWLFVQVKETTVNPVSGSKSIPTEWFTAVQQKGFHVQGQDLQEPHVLLCKDKQKSIVRLLSARIGFPRTPRTVVQG
jgi:hypothetical protein